MKKILVPTDFSEFSDCGLSSAACLARKSEGEIILFHVLEEEEEESEIMKKMKKMQKSPHLKGVKNTIKIGKGKLVKSIVKEPADVIVIGDKEVHGVSGFFSSNIAEKVAKSTLRPVFTVKKHTDLGNVESIVYPTDMRKEQQQIINDVKTLQKFYGAHLHLIKVYSDIMLKEQEVEKRLKDFAEYYELKNFSLSARNNTNERDEIIAFAEELDADMIAMATHDHQGLERLVGGYISGGLLRGCSTPIWTKVVDSW